MSRYCASANCFEYTVDKYCDRCKRFYDTLINSTSDHANEYPSSTELPPNVDAELRSIPATQSEFSFGSSEALSQVNSYTTTPQSSTSHDILSTQHRAAQPGRAQRTPSRANSVRPWKYHDPQEPVRPKKKGGNKCHACHPRQKCIPSSQNPHVCEKCYKQNTIEKNIQAVYCKGPIKAPAWIDSDAWSRLAASFQSGGGSSLERTASETQLYKITIISSNGHAAHATPSAVPKSRGPEYVLYELDLQDLLRKSSELHSDERMEQVLSIVQTGQREPEQWDQIENFYSVTAFKWCCERFMAGIALLSIPDACKLDPALGKDPAAPYLVLELLRQISVKCFRLFEQIFARLNAFNNGKRSKRSKEYHGDKAAIAQYLGRLHGSIRSLNKNMQDWPHFCFSVANLNLKVNHACDTLNVYASLDRDEFEMGAKAEPGLFTGIHVLPDHRDAGAFSLSSAFTFTEIMKRHARYLEISSQYPPQYPDNRILASTVQQLNNGGIPSTGARQIPQSSVRPQQPEESGQSTKSIVPCTEALDCVSSRTGISGEKGCLSPSTLAEENETLEACDDLYG